MRPEGTDGGYDSFEPVDSAAMDDFVPLRPSEVRPGSSPRDHGVHRAAADGVSPEGGYRSGLWNQRDRGDRRASTEQGVDAEPKKSGSWWTEAQPAQYKAGDRIQNTRAVGGMFGDAVREGSIGRVESTRQGLFEKHVTVRFDSGYTAEVKPDAIEKKGWF